jgi:hypothetical protein
MSIHMDDAIQTGWEVFARDGSRAGTVAGVDGEQLRITLDEGDAERTVSRSLVMEAHGGRVELDIAPEELGLRPSTSGPSAPQRDPGAPPAIVIPEHSRRLTGG